MIKKSFVLILLAVFSLTVNHSTLQLSPIELKAHQYRWELAEWEIANLTSKWRHRASNFLFGASMRNQDLRQKVADYLELGKSERQILTSRERLSATPEDYSEIELGKLEMRLQEVSRRMARLQPEVEEFLEGELGLVLKEQDILLTPGPFQFTFPPVDFRFDKPPQVLILSSRGHIKRIGPSILLSPSMTISEIERLEESIFISENLSALIEPTGGIATYPAVISNNQPLRILLQTAAHEWLHQYLIFKPLGRQYWKDQRLLTLNETVATLAGKELGDLAYVRLGGKLTTSTNLKLTQESGNTQNDFVFASEMRKTRLRVDQLLTEGKIVEAEAYMEERRSLFEDHGFHIRKLNQAYFAFHGSYGTSPASSSRLGPEITEVRNSYPSLSLFIKDISELSSYEEFRYLLKAKSSQDENGR
jgi:hypothetical protein